MFEYLSHRNSFQSAILMRVSGTLSFIGSTVILYAILSDRRNKLQRIQYRLLLGACSFDIIYSLANIAATAPIPKDTPDVYQIYGNVGTPVTCKIQGFMIQLGLGLPFYMASLSLYYLLVIRYNMKDESIARKIEPALHAVSILLPVSFALAALFLNLYHQKICLCWINVEPLGCHTTDGLECTAASNAPAYSLWFANIWVFLMICFEIVAMGLIYFTVRQREAAMKTFAFRGKRGNILSQSSTKLALETKETAIQACLYIFSFLFTYSWLIGGYIIQRFDHQPNQTSINLTSFFMPLLGVWNFIAYIRPRYVRIGREFGDRSFLWKLKATIAPNDSMTAVTARNSPKKDTRIKHSVKMSGTIERGKVMSESYPSNRENHAITLNQEDSEVPVLVALNMPSVTSSNHESSAMKVSSDSDSPENYPKNAVNVPEDDSESVSSSVADEEVERRFGSRSNTYTSGRLPYRRLSLFELVTDDMYKDRLPSVIRPQQITVRRMSLPSKTMSVLSSRRLSLPVTIPISISTDSSIDGDPIDGQQ